MSRFSISGSVGNSLKHHLDQQFPTRALETLQLGHKKTVWIRRKTFSGTGNDHFIYFFRLFCNLCSFHVKYQSYFSTNYSI